MPALPLTPRLHVPAPTARFLLLALPAPAKPISYALEISAYIGFVKSIILGRQS
jgi:hypothetical protein